MSASVIITLLTITGSILWACAIVSTTISVGIILITLIRMLIDVILDD